MSTTKSRTRRSSSGVTNARRRQPQPPSLQLTTAAGHTDWTCPVCRARGTVQHFAGADQAAIVALAREQHAIKQPSCEIQ